MKTKICTKCGIDKPVSEFNKDKYKADGLSGWCRKDTRQKGRENYIKYKQEILEYQKVYNEENKEYVKLQQKEYRRTHKKEIIKANKKRWDKYRKENNVVSFEERRKYREEHPEEMIGRQRAAKKKWAINNPDYDKEYGDKNKEKINKRHKYAYHNNIGGRKDRGKAWKSKNKDRINEKQRKRGIIERKDIKDRYLKKLLEGQGFKISDISQGLIVAKRSEIKLKRAINSAC